GRSVVVPARFGTGGQRWPARGGLVRDGEHLLWLSRRPLRRPVRLDPRSVAQEGRFVDSSGSSLVDWTYRDYAVRSGEGGVLRVAEWRVPVLDVLRTTPARARGHVRAAAATPRSVLLVPAVVALASLPIAMAWTNGEEVTARVTGHDREYQMCHVAWTSPQGAGTASVDCDLEPVGSTLSVRALGFPMSGEAADTVWTWDAVRGVTGTTAVVALVLLLGHLSVALALRATTLRASPPRDGAEPDGVGHGLTRWQRRAVERAAVWEPAARSDGSAPGWARRLAVACGAVASAGGGWLTAAAFALIVAAIFLGFAGSTLWQLRQADELATVEVVEAGTLSLPFLTRESRVRTEDGKLLFLTSWTDLEEGQVLRVDRAGDALGLPGDPGHEIELAQGVLALTVAGGCLYVVRRRLRGVRVGSAGALSPSEAEDVPYAAFRMPDGPTLVVLLEHDGTAGLGVLVRGVVPPVGTATVPRSRRPGHVLAPVIDGRTRVPKARAEEITDAEIEELVTQIA
ncbi:MAG TPA: hypothetical protein VFZ64_08900, partial [Nocardioidaceae bacterium]